MENTIKHDNLSSWISVDERLPHDDFADENVVGEYQVICDDGEDPYVTVAVYDKNGWGHPCADGSPVMYFYTTNYKITHWAPLLSLPESN